MKTTDMAPKRNDIPFLDGVRGMAALIVVFSHLSNSGFFQLGGFSLREIGKTGVFLFFVLSAFLLSRLLAESSGNFLSASSLMRYAFRRFLRIYPLYLLYLIAALISSIAAMFFFGEKSGLPFYVTLIDFADHILLRSGFGVTWSIAVEFKYYFVLPFVTAAFCFAIRYGFWAALFLYVLLVATSLSAFPPERAATDDIRLGPYLPLFLTGSFVGVCDARRREITDRLQIRLTPKVASVLWTIVGGACLALIFTLTVDFPSLFRGLPVERRYLHDEFLMFAVLWGGVLLGARYGADFLRAPFETALMRYLGTISFSIYLIHIVIIKLAFEMVNNIGGGWWLWTLLWIPMIVVTVGLSHLSFKLFERPFQLIQYKPRVREA